MSTPPRRRQRRGAVTRRRIAEAAAALFVERGYAGTSMQDVADAAGVHVQTVYLAFGTKGAVLAEAATVVVAGDEDAETPPSERRWAVELMAEPDPAAQLALYVRHIVDVAVRYGPLLAVIRGAALSEPEVVAFLRSAEAGRYEGPSVILAAVAARGGLRPGLAARRAADIVYAVAAPDTYRALHADRGWSRKAVEAWMTDTLCRELLAGA